MSDDKILAQLRAQYPDFHTLAKLCGARSIADVAHQYLKQGDIDLTQYALFSRIHRIDALERLEAKIDGAHQQGKLIDLSAFDLIRYAQAQDSLAEKID